MIPRLRAGMLLAAALVAACAGPARMPVPPGIEPPAGEALALEVAANGVQVYQCRAKAGGGAAHEWVFVAPDAVLLDARGRRVGTHGAGPNWEASDGSRIEGVVKGRADAPVAGTIPWLLLTTRSTGPAGTLGSVTSVQRVDTSGGVAPAAGCDAAHVGESARVPYTAVYRFFTARRAEWQPRWEGGASIG